MPSREKPDAIALLKEDHRKVEDLFAQFEKARGDDRKGKLALEICKELTIHSLIEEEIFYPACAGKVEDDLLKEAFVEHDAAKVLIAELEAGEPSEDFYDAKVKVLQEEIEHHVEEEEQQWFPKVREELGRKELSTLGEALEEAKARRGLPVPKKKAPAKKQTSPKQAPAKKKAKAKAVKSRAKTRKR